MMEALDQQQTQLPSNRDAGGVETGASGSGSDAGATCSEEDDFEESLFALGLAKAGNNNNAAAEEKDDEKRKESANDVINLTLANGQGSSDRQESRDGTEAAAEAAKKSPVDLGEDTQDLETKRARSPPVKQEQVDESQDELPEPPSTPLEDKVTPPSPIEMETDSEKEAEDEFLSCKDPKSPDPDPESEEEAEQNDKESQPSNELPVGEEVSAAKPETEATPQPTREFLMEESDTVDSPSLTMDLDHVDLPSSENGEANIGAIKMESESEEEYVGESGKSKGTAPAAADNVVPPIKLNGAHSSVKEEQKDEEETQDAEQFQQERDEMEPAEPEPQQLSVIPNHTGTHDHAEATAAPQEPSLPLVRPVRRSSRISWQSSSSSCASQPHHADPAPQEPSISLVQSLRMSLRRTSKSSSSSSASQPQLVIDHTETEQNFMVPSTLNLSKKRRRNKSSSVSQPDQQPKKLSAGSSSLLLQRLKGNPNVGPTGIQFLSCFKCNLQFEFESVQLLREHQAQCRGTVTSVSTAPYKGPQPKMYFYCDLCNYIHESWDFLVHMKEVHGVYCCLYCSKTLSSAEKLSLHLEIKHDKAQVHVDNKAWLLATEEENRAQKLICCTCHATFTVGDDFSGHDCSKFMQPCAQCGQKGNHAVGCRNSKRKSRANKRRRNRKPPEPSAPPPVQEHVALAQPSPVEMASVMAPQQLLFPPEPQPCYLAENIPVPEPVAEPPAPEPFEEPPASEPFEGPSAPEPFEEPPAPEFVEEPPAPPSPILAVPKLTLRVAKAFHIPVDAVVSSTDTEEETEEMDVTQPAEEPALAPAPPPEYIPMEAALPEAAPSPPPVLPITLGFDDSATAKLSRVMAELDRTKLDIERTKADIKKKKKQAKVIMAQAEVENVIAQAADARLRQQHPQPDEQRRWSLTPPASPHNNNHHNHMNLPQPPPAVVTEFQDQADAERRNSLGSDCMDIDDSLNGPNFEQQEENSQESLSQPEGLQEGQKRELLPLPPADGILVAGAETRTVDLQLDRPLDRFAMVDFVRLCLRSVYTSCLFCNHARRIAVNGKQLLLHLIGQHRFTATVDSITAEELYAETIVAKLKSFLPHLEHEYLNAASYCSIGDGRYVEEFNERIYECFNCRFVTSTHKDLYTHNRRLHAKSNISCLMCQMNFYSYSEILCHICPGEVGGSIYDLKFRCCLCDVAPLPSAFRLMVHLRKQHQACDICLEDCLSQSKLSAHVWKHKLLHLCYRCGIAYRNKQDISKHLFWKHGTESASCKRCLQKRWRHVYHFCVPPAQFPCEQCGFNFSKAIYLEVHQRMHSGDFRYACAEEGCKEKFVSRKLLLNHASSHVAKDLPPQEALMAPTDEAATGDQKLENMIKMEAGEGEETQVGKPAEEKHLAAGEAKETDKKEDPEKNKESVKEQSESKSENRKRRKKSKRSKESLEDLNLIAPNLSESDSSDDSDSDAPRSSHREQPAALPMRSSVDDLDMPKVMLSPSSESDADDPMDGKPKLEKKPVVEDSQKGEKSEQDDTKPEEEGDSKKENDEEMDVSIWKNLLQNQEKNPEDPAAIKEEVIPPETPPAKLHVAWSDHDYCKLHRTPPPSPVKQKSPAKSASKRSGAANASSDSDSSSCSSSSDSDSSSCSCGSNCSCSSSNSSSSSDDSDDSDSSNNAAGPQQKRARKKSLKHKKGAVLLTRAEPQVDVDINVTAFNEDNPAPPPSPQPPMYNESDFDTAFSDTDEEFYDPHPQKLANELLTQKREALLAEHAPLGPSNNYDIVENSRPSTPSLPEELLAFADKRERGRNKKRKRERKSTCKSGKMPPMVASTPLPMAGMPGVSAMSEMVAPPGPPTPMPVHHHESSLFPVTPLTHRHLQPSLTPMSEGSSCSDPDGQLKRSKRQRRPNKFYGYTSDDENMSTILAPPLQVGMQLIKPQPPPQLTWAKEDLPTPAKQRSRNNNNNSGHHHSHSHSNGGSALAGSSRKRSKQRSQLGAGGSRPAKRHKPDREDHLPPIPTLKIRPSLLPTAPPTDSSDSSSEDEDVEVNVTSLVPTPQPVPTPPVITLPVQPPPPPPPAATAFNQPIPPALLPNPGFATLQYFKANNIRYPIRPPAGARLAREGESVYCYCRCPYDEVSEMIACDGDNCLIEWFHFECVGIMVAPQGKWFCAECRPKYSEGVYQGAKPQ